MDITIEDVLQKFTRDELLEALGFTVEDVVARYGRDELLEAIELTAEEAVEACGQTDLLDAMSFGASDALDYVGYRTLLDEMDRGDVFSYLDAYDYLYDSIVDSYMASFSLGDHYDLYDVVSYFGRADCFEEAIDQETEGMVDLIEFWMHRGKQTEFIEKLKLSMADYYADELMALAFDKLRSQR